MAMKICKECGSEVSSKGVCPKCGKDQRNFFIKHKVVTFFLIVIILGVIGGAAGGKKDTQTSTNNEEKIENKGTDKLSYNPLYFKMQNSQGQQESMTFTTVDSGTSLNSGELVAGGKVSGTITFEEPIGDTDLMLIYNDNVWSSKEVKIKLQ